ncbi:MAG TPA: LysR family transcriptional regulator [Herpetosiphonaceae bacterium]
MELRHLHSFVAVAEELHFGRAARRLHLAQQPLSLQIRQLETELKVNLFVRTTRRVQLTAAGTVFLQQARQILAQSAQAAALAQRAARGEIGRVAIGYTTTLLYAVLPALLRAFRARCPDVAITLRELCGMDLQAALLAGEIDVAFYEIPMADTRICAAPLFLLPVMVALPAGHALGALDAIPLAALAGESIIQYARDKEPFVHDQLIALCRAAGFSPIVSQEASSEQAVLGLVAAGLGVGLVSPALRGFWGGDVIYRPLSEPQVTVEFGVAWRRDSVAPSADRLVQLACELAADGLRAGAGVEDAALPGRANSLSEPAASPREWAQGEDGGRSAAASLHAGGSAAGSRGLTKKDRR